jgi:hypothetical protein
MRFIGTSQNISFEMYSLILWRKPLLAVFSEEHLKNQPGFLDVPYVKKRLKTVAVCGTSALGTD